MKEYRITKHDNIEFKDFKGFATEMYERKWWLGCELDKYPDNEEIKLIFLQSKQSSLSFYYQSYSDILVLKYSDILNLVDPITDIGKTQTFQSWDEKCIKYFSKENLLKIIYIYIYKQTGLVEYLRLFLFQNLQMKTFKSSYFWVKFHGIQPNLFR